MGPIHLLGFALVGIFGDVSAAKAEPLDRIMAVVGDQPLFLSELRQRARPHMVRLEASAPNATARASTVAEMHRDLLKRMIDERLEAREADSLHVTVGSDEVDTAIKHVATAANLSPADLLVEARKQGLTESDYRDEIKRQVLEGKLLQLRVRSRVKVTDADARAMYAAFIKERNGLVDLRMLVLRVALDPSGASKTKTEALATQLATQAKSGSDFCALVSKHSDDSATKTTCGSRGPTSPSSLFPEIAKAAAPLKPGETSAPVAFTDPSGTQVYLIIQRVPGAPSVPTFEKVKEQMHERAYAEATERERKKWLEDLRMTVYVEVKP